MTPRRLTSLNFIAELDVVLRAMKIQATDKPGGKSYSRGVAYTPKQGARIVVHHRSPSAQLKRSSPNRQLQ
jgi:hypothetical protein